MVLPHKVSSMIGILLITVALSAPAPFATPPVKTEIKSLPGWVDENGASKPLPSKMYTGYLDAGTPPSGKGTMYFHYWMVESEKDPVNDPVMIWYNGGPGASSLFGLLQEWGPLRLTERSYDDAFNKSGVPSPLLNEFRWTRTHTMIAIDSPPPMGLSFCSEAGPSGSATSCGPWTDKSVFAANHKAHRTLFEKVFPELKKNPFYFTGESYAGVYVPGFADALLADPIPGLNFQGWAVGDGWTGCKKMPGRAANWCVDLDNVGMFKYPNVYPGPYYDVEFFHGHSQFSTELYKEIKKACTDMMMHGTKPMSKSCSALIDQMADEVGYWFPYNLYNDCPSSAMSATAPKKTDKHGMNAALRTRRAAMVQLAQAHQQDSELNSPCLGNAMNEWLLLPQTLTAIGAPLDTNFTNLDNGHGFDYTSDQEFVGDIYERALKAGKKIMIYEGDVDACGLQTANVEDIFVPLFAEIGLNKTQRWRPWTVDGYQSMGGYVIGWDHATSAGGARFVSLRGSGHLAPLNRPHVTLTMMESFTGGTELPKFMPNQMRAAALK